MCQTKLEHYGKWPPRRFAILLCSRFLDKGTRRISLGSPSFLFGGQGGWLETKLSFASKTQFFLEFPKLSLIKNSCFQWVYTSIRYVFTHLWKSVDQCFFKTSCKKNDFFLEESCFLQEISREEAEFFCTKNLTKLVIFFTIICSIVLFYKSWSSFFYKN